MQIGYCLSARQCVLNQTFCISVQRRYENQCRGEQAYSKRHHLVLQSCISHIQGKIPNCKENGTGDKHISVAVCYQSLTFATSL